MVLNNTIKPKHNIVIALRGERPLIDKLCKDLNSCDHCTVEANLILGEDDLFLIKTHATKIKGCPRVGLCYSIIKSLLGTKFYTNLKEEEYYV